jgi:hypothetical protein
VLNRSQQLLLEALVIGAGAVLVGLAGLASAAAIAVVPLDSDFQPNALWQWALYGLLFVPLAAICCVRAISVAAKAYGDAWELLISALQRAAPVRNGGDRSYRHS